MFACQQNQWNNMMYHPVHVCDYKRCLSSAYLEGFEVVDEDIWHPEVVDEVEIDGVQLIVVHRAEMWRSQCNHPVYGWVRLREAEYVQLCTG